MKSYCFLTEKYVLTFIQLTPIFSQMKSIQTKQAVSVDMQQMHRRHALLVALETKFDLMQNDDFFVCTRKTQHIAGALA